MASRLGSFAVDLITGFAIAIRVGALSLQIVRAGMGCGFTCAAGAGAGAATADLLYAILACMTMVGRRSSTRSPWSPSSGS